MHLGLGCMGTLTNGAIRDIDTAAPTFQMLAGCIAPSHAHVHLVEYGVPVRVHGLEIDDGDLVHADRHGAVVIPVAAATELPKAIDVIARREALIIEASRHPGFSVADIRRAMAEGDDIR